MTAISPEAQKIIDRLAAHPWRRDRIDRDAVQIAILKHLDELGLPHQPFRWFGTAKEGYEAARSAAWSAAEVNALSVFNHPTQARLAGIWLPMVKAYDAGLWLYWITQTDIICVEQPCLHIADDRLHREDGPAVEWPAGEAYYFWRGTQVPKDWIEDRKHLDAKTALTWGNIEQRRAACEMIGWHRILSELKAKTINRHSDPQIGELVEVILPDSGKERFLRVLCGTGREFALPVPREMKSAIEAQAWTWGLSPKEFKQPEIRT